MDQLTRSASAGRRTRPVSAVNGESHAICCLVLLPHRIAPPRFRDGGGSERIVMTRKLGNRFIAAVFGIVGLVIAGGSAYPPEPRRFDITQYGASGDDATLNK